MCFHKVKRGIGTASGWLQRLVRYLHLSSAHPQATSDACIVVTFADYGGAAGVICFSGAGVDGEIVGMIVNAALSALILVSSCLIFASRCSSLAFLICELIAIAINANAKSIPAE